MSELVVYKANELAVSRYDLTEHETKLILCCVAQLNPTIDNPNEEERTVEFTYQKYAEIMGISAHNAYHRLNKATKDLMTRTIEIIYPEGDISKRIFQWVNYAEFNRKTQSASLRFSKEIIPYLFQLKKFIKYNLNYVKAFENKYSMRVYEWILKELTQRNTYRDNIEISIYEFKFMLMLEKNYHEYKLLNHWVLKPITKDLNTYSNMKLAIGKRGRPADTLIFQVELFQQIDLDDNRKVRAQKPCSTTRTQIPSINMTADELLYKGLENVLQRALIAKIQLTKFDAKFLYDMQSKYHLNASFSWLTDKQRTKLENTLSKYREF
ncbi:replication initiation protein [Escherichia coli]|nr:replication initiation protein [Escherichia coli]ELC8119506.1 replication initiation protein [Escherichia coli]EMA2754233.1 replication initiation protein [Escherichia coli]MBB7084190.1 replication initiation protein [Escherichia coli]HBN7445653.1 replication initiation protein [Escherichia coli]